MEHAGHGFSTFLADLALLLAVVALALLVQRPWSGIGIYLISFGLVQLGAVLLGACLENRGYGAFAPTMVRDIGRQLNEAMNRWLNRRK